MMQFIRAIKNNLVPIIKSLHKHSSRIMEGIKHHLKKGHIVVVDISMLSTGIGNQICGLILNELFNENQKNFSSGDEGQMIKVIVTIEEAQTVLPNKLNDNSPFVRWAKEGRKYRLGAILVTQNLGPLQMNSSVRETISLHFIFLVKGIAKHFKGLTLIFRMIYSPISSMKPLKEMHISGRPRINRLFFL